ncbi:hypothetical protein K0F62_21550 [Bacteroides fragilis]|nr:hypothetical protein [Bacteroides fragilis]MCE8639551.1 hypothetical protein [Bacteroides fragilis]
MATKLRYFNMQEKASKTALPPTPLQGGFVFVFPFVFRPFFPKVGKQLQLYEPVSILTSTIYVYPRARALCEEKVLQVRHKEYFNTT